ncbi:MAG: integrase catalytic domain-containing protein [Terriglobia bacterium]
MVDLCLNHNWKAQGYASKGEFMAALAKRNETSVRNVQRWIVACKQGENLLDLAPKLPGPKRGEVDNSILDADMRAHLVRCWRIEKLTLRQCYASLVAYLEGKQDSPGCKVDHLYVIPSRTTVERFIRSLSEIDDAAREGPDALKAVVGHIDRTYRDIRSLDRVGVDEWIVDALAYDSRNVSRVGRYYVLTFLDERSRYPLVWSVVEQPNEQGEIDLLCRLIREFGIPGLINSDRGRFRGRTFGGRFLNRDRAEMYQERDGILDRLGIARNEPRQHNPRGNRLERFHLELANWARTLPGWCGSDTKERRMTDADARVALHKQWVRTGPGEAPLLSCDQLLERLNQFMAEFRQRPSDGNDMDGFAPEAVFRRCAPAEGFRRISDDDLEWKTAESFNVLIGKGGIIQLRDGKRYSDPQLILIQGQHREVARSRQDHEQISVLPSAKGEAVIIAKRRTRVGVNDPDQLAAAMELQNRERKLVGRMVKPLEYEPGAQFSEAKTEGPKAAQVIHPSEFISAQEAAPPPEREISSVEYSMNRERYRKPMDFADLEE